MLPWSPFVQQRAHTKPYRSPQTFSGGEGHLCPTLALPVGTLLVPVLTLAYTGCFPTPEGSCASAAPREGFYKTLVTSP